MIICPQPNFGEGLVSDGISEFCPNNNAAALYFTEIVLNGNLIIPPQKPPKTHIVKVTHLVKITDVEVLNIVPPSPATSGYKIVVSGVITLGIQYIADTPDQKVHFVHYDLPFNAIIVKDCGALIPSEPTDIVAHVCVEKIRLTQIDPRTISKEIVLMVWIEQQP